MLIVGNIRVFKMYPSQVHLTDGDFLDFQDQSIQWINLSSFCIIEHGVPKGFPSDLHLLVFTLRAFRKAAI